MKMYAVKMLNDNSVGILMVKGDPTSKLEQANAEMIGAIEEQDLPDKYFRNCWRKSGADSIAINMPLARAQIMAEIRSKRDEYLVKSDAKQMEMVSKGEDTTDLFALKQALRDLPDSIDLDGLNADELKALDTFDTINTSLLG
jgi:hypothetical protein